MAIQSKAQSLYGDDPAGVTLGKIDLQRSQSSPQQIETMISIAILKTMRLLESSDVVLTEMLAVPAEIAEQSWSCPYRGRIGTVSPLHYAVVRALTCLEDHSGAEVEFTARDIRNGVFRAAEKCASVDQTHGELLEMFAPAVENGDALIERVEDLIYTLCFTRRVELLDRQIDGEQGMVFTPREFWQS